MRDPDRIDEITEELRLLWHKHPDWRLGQLVYNICTRTEYAVHGLVDVFFVEDDCILPAIKEVNDYYNA